MVPLNGTPILEWYMARLLVKNGYQKIGLCSQNIDDILGSILNRTESTNCKHG